MNKNTIKKFAIEARKKLIDSVTDKAGMLGITEKSCSEPITKGPDFEVYQTVAGTEVTLNKNQCEQRKKLVSQIESRGFEAVVEEVAYTWFNRICAIRFMEVNDYLPNRVRVLSSEKEGKMEPDLVTRAPDVDLNLTAQEKEEIINWKMSGTSEDTDKLYCKLFLKQCHQLHDILPGLFEADSDYMELLFGISYTNKDDVIYIDFSRLPENCQTYEEYINRIKTGIKEDLFEEFPELELKEEMSLWDILAKIFQKTNRKFMFIMDEWDAVFHMPFISQKERQEYLLFLKNLLKDQVYVELAYMTGILPIAKYSAASELNMFVEYNMATRERFSSYFGFSEEEVDKLFQIYSETTIRPRITRHDLKIWYDGYCTASGEQLYNPRSIICALSDNQLGSYWTGSGPYDEIFYYIKGNIDEVREDFILMISGEHIEAKVQEYAATAEELTTKNQIYSAMVIYGLLTYEDGEVFIPNRELMYKYNELLLTNESLGYVYRLAKESERMLKATLAGDTQTMAEILEYAHNTESPILSYNNEIELSAIVNLVYLAARDKYRVEREDK